MQFIAIVVFLSFVHMHLSLASEKEILDWTGCNILLLSIQSKKDPKTEELLMSSLRPLILKALRRYNLPSNDIEDVAQDILLYTFQNFDRVNSIKRWIGVACFHKAVNLRRAQTAHSSTFRPLRRTDLQIVDKSFLSSVQEARLRELVFEAIESLRRFDIELFQYYFEQGRTLSEIAEILSISSSSAHLRLKKLYQRIQDYVDSRHP